MTNARRRTMLPALGLALAAFAAAPAAAAPTTAVRAYEGTVLSVDAERRTFRLRDSELGTIRIRVTARTRFERIDGFAGLSAGMRNVEAVVRRADGRWVALAVERSGGGGEHGGRDDDD